MLPEEIAEENDFTVFESKFENVFKNKLHVGILYFCHISLLRFSVTNNI